MFMMKDSNSKMPDNMRAPPFKLERELTLMPNEFHERMSAKRRNQKPAVARSGFRRNPSRNSSSTLRSARSVENANGFQMAQYINSNTSRQYPAGYDNYESGEPTSGSTTGDQMSTINENTSLDYDMNRTFTVAQSPNIMHIRDILIPFNDWNQTEVIREKKYKVLPSINKSKANSTDRMNSTTMNHENVQNPSVQLTGSYSNQLDYGRDRMEMEADFFADFRINTSVVRETPRQNPLPPIKQAGESPRTLGELRQVYRNVTSSSGSRQASGKHMDNRHYKPL